MDIATCAFHDIIESKKRPMPRMNTIGGKADMYKRIVLQGGGVKGMALVGALKALDERGVTPREYVGTSAGAIVGALAAAGYGAEEIKQIFMDLNFESLLDGSPRNLFLFRKLGMHKGEKFRKWIAELLEKKGVTTFADIERMGRSFKVIATNITKRQALLLPDSQEMAVADAVRMSMSLPFFFAPVERDFSHIVDGGVLSNFPLTFTSDEDDPATLGIRLRSQKASGKANGIMEYLKHLLGTMLDAHDAKEIEDRHIDIVTVDVGDVTATDFALDRQQKINLFNNGYAACSAHLSRNREAAAIMRVKAPPTTLKFSWPHEVDSDDVTRIRCSMSGLVRVRCGSKYLLVNSERRPGMFQPIGGVFKWRKSAEPFLTEIGAEPDNNIVVDHDSIHDLRVNVPKKNLKKFLSWYMSRRGRETSPEREFREETLTEGLLPVSEFAHIHLEFFRTRVEGLRISPAFGCWELLVADIFDLESTEQQEKALLHHQQTQPQGNSLIWASEDQIRRRGWTPNVGRQDMNISDHSLWLLENA